MYSQTSTLAPLRLESFEVEVAFFAACAHNAFPNTEEKAQLSQMVCCWHVLNDDSRANVLRRIRKYFTLH